MSVALHELIAKVGIVDVVMFHLWFSDWDNGWQLSVDPTDTVTSQQIRDFVGATHSIVSGVPTAHGVRWFRDEMLTCGMLHDGDFERGTESPFRPCSSLALRDSQTAAAGENGCL